MAENDSGTTVRGLAADFIQKQAAEGARKAVLPWVLAAIALSGIAILRTTRFRR